MKERIFYEDEFEHQLKLKADQFKMYPSDKVWNEVHSSLHTRRRRFIAGMSVLIGGILLLAGSQLILPSKTAASKTIIARITPVAKPVPEADISSFTEKSFTNSNDVAHSGVEKRVAKVPYVSADAVNQGTGTASTKASTQLPAVIVSSVHVKTAQTASPSVAGHTLAAKEPETESDNAQALSLMMSKSTTEPSTEKAVPQISRQHNERFSWELYITPTFNTHTLSGMNSRTMMPSISSAPIMMIHIANVNGFVDNTPAMGYNVGGNFLYHISKNISLKAGVEFSYSRYYLRTYNSNQTQAAAVLNSYFGYVADSLVSANNGMGLLDSKNPQRFQNKYYQISVPVGVEMKVAGSGRLQLHAGLTVQPTYMLNTDAYVLSASDSYNTYTKDPEAFRRWNLSAGGEVFLSYGVGNVRWEIGPQVRYQLLSTYRDSYSLKENMFNYGIRIGISKTIR